MCGVQGNGGNRKTDEEGVSEMEGGHGSEFISKAVVRPNGAFPARAVDCVYESANIMSAPAPSR